jgi:hypothetical protein
VYFTGFDWCIFNFNNNSFDTLPKKHFKQKMRMKMRLFAINVDLLGGLCDPAGVTKIMVKTA